MSTNMAETLSTALDMQDEVYDLEPVIQQARFGSTTQHIKRVEDFVSGQTHVKIYKEQYSGARVNATLEADMNYASGIDVDDVAIQESHFRRIDFPLARTILVSKQMSYDKHSTFDLAVELQIEALEAAMEKENFLLNSDANCVKGYIAYVYDEDGTDYTSGQTDAFLKITGSISAFHAGERIHVASAAGDATPNLKLKVNDVIADEYFRGVNVGPGIVVTIDTDGPGTSSADADFDTVAAAANDAPSTYIVYSTDEASTASQNFPGAFGALCDYAASPAAYFGITRTAVGSAWAIPYGRWYDSDGDGTGTKVVLDIDTHFGAMFKTFGRTLSAARQYRKNRKFQLTDGIICQASPDLIAEVAKQAGDSSTRFTVQAATSLSEGQRKNLTAVAGWEGVVLHTPYSSMPPIVLQEEPLMPDGLIRVFEPSACVKYCLGGRKPQWVPNGSGNGYWHNRRNATTGNLTMTLDAAGFFVCTYFWDQPRLVYQMGGLKDSL